MTLLDRRQALKTLGAGGALALAGPLGCTGLRSGQAEMELLTKQQAPFNAEPGPNRLSDSWLTPLRFFYVRSHGPVPQVDPGTFRVSIEGMAMKPFTLGLEELEELPSVDLVATLECAGNRRSEHSRIKAVGGVQWDSCAIGNARWRGPRLADLLQKAGIRAGTKHVWFEGLDECSFAGKKTFFGSSIPLAKALRPETIVALKMNDKPLAPEHGFPARIVVPGFVGVRCVKWVARIVLSDRPSENPFSARDYKLFPPEVTAETARWEEKEPLYELALNSAILRPGAGASLPSGKARVRGYAIAPGSQGSKIALVEVTPDGGRTWHAARLSGPQTEFAWRLWEVELDLSPGSHVLAVRATDSEGKTQPDKPAWNFKGYLYNGWHRVPVTVA